MLEHFFERNCHNIETRNSNIILRVPKIKLESTKRAFFYNGVVAYNALLLKLRTEDDYNSFCKKLDLLLGVQAICSGTPIIFLLASFLFITTYFVMFSFRYYG